MSNIREEIKNIFCEVMDLSDINFTDDLSAEKIDAWDSLAHINLIGAIERRYRIRFALGELDEMKRIGDLLQAVGKKINK